MIFSQYEETCELLLDNPAIEGEIKKDYVKKAIRNILHPNIDVHSRRLIAELPGDGIIFSKLQSRCAKMTFLKKVYIKEFSRTLHIKKGVRNELHQEIQRYTGFISFSGK